MDSLLSTWTYGGGYDELPGFGDARIPDRFEAHGATVIAQDGVPDINLVVVQKAEYAVLWIRYRNREHFIRSGDDFDSQFTKILLDMAIIRLGEMRQEINKKLGK